MTTPTYPQGATGDADGRGTGLLTAAAFLIAAGHATLGIERETLIFMGEDWAYRTHARWAGSVLCAAAVPLYVALLRRWPRRRVTLAMSILPLCAIVTCVLALARAGAGVLCSLTMAASTFAVMHLWAVASDVDRSAGLRRLPWLAFGASVGTVLPRALAHVIREHVHTAVAPLLSAGMFVAAMLAVMAHEAGEEGSQGRTGPAGAEARPSGAADVIEAFRSRQVWILACLTVVLGCTETLVGGLGVFPETERVPHVVLLAVGGAGVLVLAVPLLRRTQAALVALWPVTVAIAAVAVLLGATQVGLTACDVALAAAATVTAVARQSLFLSLPRGQRFAPRAALWFWVWPLGAMAGNLVAWLWSGAWSSLAVATLIGAAIGVLLAFIAGAGLQNRS